jgi:hypothetical protein
MERVGAFCASDHSALLPLIDMVNHATTGGKTTTTAAAAASHANVRVGRPRRRRVKQRRDGQDDEDDDTKKDENEDEEDYSTSLIATRTIAAGEELLLDYGGGDGDGGYGVTNDRLLLDYGFVVSSESTPQVTLTLEEFLPSITALGEFRTAMKQVVSEEDKLELSHLIRILVTVASTLGGGAPIVFVKKTMKTTTTTNEEETSIRPPEPTPPTLALALAMTCRGPKDLERLLEPSRRHQQRRQVMEKQQQQQQQQQEQEYLSRLPLLVIENSSIDQIEFARTALRNAVQWVLEQRMQKDQKEGKPIATEPHQKQKQKGGFARVAHDYAMTCRELLEQIVSLPSSTNSTEV